MDLGLLASFPVPVPPRDAEMPGTTQDVLIIAAAVEVVAVAFYAVRAFVGQRNPIPLYLMIGAFFIVFYEPIGDHLLGAYYPEVDQITAVRAFGRDMPLFILLMYAPLVVPFVMLFMRQAQKGFSRRMWWIFWGVLLVSEGAMEMVVMQFGNPWLYYGDQPFVVFDLPLWVVGTNVTFIFLIAVVTYGITQFLDARHHWLVLPAVPIMTVAGHAAVALPGGMMVQGTDDDLLLMLGGALSIGVAVLISYALSLVFCRELKPAPLPPDIATATAPEPRARETV